MGERLAGLLESVLEQPEVSVDQARLVLREMASGMDELRAAEDEFTAQAEQLLVSHAAIDRERERYAELFELAPDACVETDAHGKIVEANATAEQLLGVPLQHLSGKLVQSFVGTDDLPTVRTVLGELEIGASPPRTVELEVVPRDLPPVTVEARVAVHFDPAPGELGELRLWWLLRDITERLKLDRDMQQLQAEVELLEAVAEVSRLEAETPDSEGPVLQALVDLAARISGGSEAGIALADAKGQLEWRALSSQSAGQLLEAQLTGGGPAMEVLADGRPRVDWADAAAAASHWTVLTGLMASSGLDWVLSRPIVLDGTAAGVFTLFGRGPVDGARRELDLLTAHASRVIANGRLYQSATEMAHHLATALESRGVIEQAKGILMAWQGCDPDRAFDILRRASQRENRKLRLVAEDIVARAGKGGLKR